MNPDTNKQGTDAPTKAANHEAELERRELANSLLRLPDGKNLGMQWDMEVLLDYIQSLLAQQRAAAEQAGYERGRQDFAGELLKRLDVRKPMEVEYRNEPSAAWDDGQTHTINRVKKAVAELLQPPQSGEKL